MRNMIVSSDWSGIYSMTWMSAVGVSMRIMTLLWRRWYWYYWRRNPIYWLARQKQGSLITLPIGLDNSESNAIILCTFSFFFIVRYKYTQIFSQKGIFADEKFFHIFHSFCINASIKWHFLDNVNAINSLNNSTRLWVLYVLDDKISG